MASRRHRTWLVVGALALLYAAQGVPFGFATEYLPVVLREQGYGYTAIAALSWLQLPWQLKILWAKVADSPRLVSRSRGVILAMQIALALTVAGFALRPLTSARGLWFTLTALAATIAATQDVFVDAFAVRVLRPDERGYGNTAQVAGYRLGMLVGGAALLLVVGALGERTTLLGCAGAVVFASVGAFISGGELGAAPGGDASPAGDAPSSRSPHQVAGDDAEDVPRATHSTAAPPTTVRALVRHMTGARAWPVLALALTYKLGLHMAGSLLKPMAVDFGWTKQQIGAAMVTVGSVGALAGSGIGGALHRWLGEQRALVTALVVQTAVCAPLVLVERLGAPIRLTTVAIFAEHFGSGLGTTVLFAALMTATRPRDAGLHYTILTSANALAIGVGGFLGGVVADQAGKLAAFVVAAIVCVAPIVFVRRWDHAAAASGG